MTRPLKPGTDRLHIGQDRQRIRDLERRSAGPWVYVGTYPTDADTRPESPPYQNSWAWEGGSTQRPRFRWLLGGGIEIQGAFAGGSYGTVAFTLPTGYIPDDGNLHLVGSDSTDTVVVFEIDAGTGNVTILGPGTAIVGDGSVTTVKLADGSVTTAKLADLSVTTAKLADLSVTTGKIVDGAVTGAKLEDDGVVAGTYGDASHVATVIVDSKGRVTTAVATAIQIAEAAVTGLVADLAAKISAAIFTTKGDILAATGAGAPARVGVGPDGDILTADSTAAAGVSWKPSTGGGSSPLTTKGDLYGHSTVDARIPVGTDGQVLTADSTQAAGVKWATPTSSGATGGSVLTNPDVPDLIFDASGDVIETPT